MLFKVWEVSKEWIDGTFVEVPTKIGSFLEEVECKNITEATSLAVGKYPDRCLRVSGDGWAVEVEGNSKIDFNKIAEVTSK